MSIKTEWSGEKAISQKSHSKRAACRRNIPQDEAELYGREMRIKPLLKKSQIKFGVCQRTCGRQRYPGETDIWSDENKMQSSGNPHLENTKFGRDQETDQGLGYGERSHILGNYSGNPHPEYTNLGRDQETVQDLGHGGWSHILGNSRGKPYFSPQKTRD